MKSIRERNPIAIGVIGIVVLVVIGLLTYYSDDLPIIGGGTTYTADFSEAAGLVSGNEVRVAGVKVGKVTGVSLDGAKVKVSFKVKDTWVGNASTVAIKIKTLLGEKYLAVDPLGGAAQNPDATIPLGRTVSPYDVTDAFNGLADTVGQINTSQLAQSFEAISNTFSNTGPDVHSTLQGLSALSETISSRDNQLAQLLANTKQITGDLANEDTQFTELLNDGGQLLTELQQRRDAISALLTGTQQLATQLSGLVTDNDKTLGPALSELDQVTTVLRNNQDNLNKALQLAGPYYRLVGNTLGSGHWMDTYLCGLIPKNYLPAGSEPDSGCIPPKPGGGS
ncbi:MAG TPA: MCE family protein [Pseudonocardiaceae bacterium]|jgi:phospholipid/cholesterol/gamma-HCH transport system substrate-binding protein|nr:MCE family protein [Pseudonocardiaceae bacterium]